MHWSEEEYAREGADRRRQGADGQPADPRVRGRATACPTDADGQQRCCAQWHRRKTEHLHRRWSPPGGCRPGRASPGSSRRRRAPGWQLAVASTSAEPSVRAVLEHAVGRRPARSASRSSRATSCRRRSRRPTSTSWRCSRLACQPDQASWSRTAATACSPRSAPDCACVVTVSSYTGDEDFTGGGAGGVRRSATRTASGPTVLADPRRPRARRRRRPGGPQRV